MQKGLVGSGLFVRDCVWPGCMVAEYYGARMIHNEADKLVTVRIWNGLQKEYQLSIPGSDVVIDTMGLPGDAKYATHSCARNDRYIMIRLRRSEVDVVFIEEVQTIARGSKVVVAYGWSVAYDNELVISECEASGYKGYI